MINKIKDTGYFLKLILYGLVALSLVGLVFIFICCGSKREDKRDEELLKEIMEKGEDYK